MFSYTGKMLTNWHVYMSIPCEIVESVFANIRLLPMLCENFMSGISPKRRVISELDKLSFRIRLDSHVAPGNSF